ncbi:hypothetical protein M6B38_124580 [Iris pallida]|uniref:Uncharacterized protein n=1 Tax=Iris pallida TaxID=29817 RepID=A0AAX6GWE5_IRIPA|nr:hypothetical protein M6B38_124580 [Iris pallida]
MDKRAASLAISRAPSSVAADR